MDFSARGMDKLQLIIVAAVVFILGGVAGFLIGRNAERGLSVSDTSGQLAGKGILGGSLATLTLGGNAIAVSDQPPGLSVAVALVTLARDGWVVVHEDREGKPGGILGAQRFDAGANQSGSVDLLRATEAGRVYLVMLHSDDGDRQFDHTKDLPVTDPQGNAILMRFVAATGPGER